MIFNPLRLEPRADKLVQSYLAEENDEKSAILLSQLLFRNQDLTTAISKGIKNILGCYPPREAISTKASLRENIDEYIVVSPSEYTTSLDDDAFETFEVVDERTCVENTTVDSTFLDQIIAGLTTDLQRQIAWLHFKSGASDSEIAEQVGTTHGSVRAQLTKIRRLLRTSFPKD